MKPVSYKRILAYLVDVLIVAFIGSLLTVFIPVSDVYEKTSSSLTEVIEDFQDKKIDEEEYLEKVNDISYVLSKESVASSIVLVVVSIIYYVVFAYYNDGQTLGKKLLKIKITSSKDKKLSMNNYLLRSLLINSILINIISVVTILVLNKANFIKVNDTVTSFFGAIYIVTFALILFRQDGRGLHDLLAGTKVVSLNNETVSNDNSHEVVNEKIEEASIVKEEKETPVKNSKKEEKSKKEPKKREVSTKKSSKTNLKK